MGKCIIDQRAFSGCILKKLVEEKKIEWVVATLRRTRAKFFDFFAANKVGVLHWVQCTKLGYPNQKPIGNDNKPRAISTFFYKD